MHDSYGNLLAYRLDVLKNICITRSSNDECRSEAVANASEHRVEFSDLVVDCWLWPSSEGKVSAEDVTVEDEDELMALCGSGVVSPDDNALIQDALKRVTSAPHMIADAVDLAIAEAIETHSHA